MRQKLPVMFTPTACSIAGQDDDATVPSDVAVYGVIDEYVNHIKSSNGASIIGLNDGAFLRSRLGFRGTEELCGSDQTMFTLEHGFAAIDGAAADQSRLFDLSKRPTFYGFVKPAQCWISLQRIRNDYR